MVLRAIKNGVPNSGLVPLHKKPNPMKKIMIAGLVCLFALPDLMAQMNNPEPWPQFPTKAVDERKMVPWREMREADAKWAKRIHRVIDTREKQNKPMQWPRNPLSKVIWDAVFEGFENFPPIPAYMSDSLKTQISTAGILEICTLEIPTMVPDPDYPNDPTALIQIMVKETLDPMTDIRKFRVMEDWVFDGKYSDFRPRIIAIAPMHIPKTESGIPLPEQPLFWLKWEDLRPVLSQQEVFNPKNDVARLSFDHFFEMRMFSSFIVKESNVYDLDIKHQDYFKDDGIEALLEAERIKNDLFITEHDLWEY